MNNQVTAAQFDAWVSRRHDYLRQRIMLICAFDEDAFQEAYLATRASLQPDESDSLFYPHFVAAYRRQVRKHFADGYKYFHPDDLYFAFLHSEEPADAMALDAVKQQREDKVKAIRKFASRAFSREDLQLFTLYFLNGFTYREISLATGRCINKVMERVHATTDMTRRNFTPPISVFATHK